MFFSMSYHSIYPLFNILIISFKVIDIINILLIIISMYHPHTVIYSNFTFRYKLENIPEPCYIVIDIPDIISIDLPTIFIQLEPNIIIDNENYFPILWHEDGSRTETIDDYLVSLEPM